MQIFYIIDNAALKCNASLRLLHKTMKKLNSKLDNNIRRLFSISSGSPINKQKSSALQGIISTLDLLQGIKCNALHYWKVQFIWNKTYHPFRKGKCNLLRIKHTTLLEGETFLRKKHKIAFY